MKSTIVFVVLISACLAQQEESVSASQRSSQAPQGHIQYSDPDGLKVSWKLYAPYSQWKSHLENPQRNQRAESGTAQPDAQSEPVKREPPAEDKQSQPLHHVQVHYKPYSMIPTHIKQLILEMYEPQGPYVDPAVYIYRAFHQPQEEEQKQQIPVEQEETQATSQTQLNAAEELFEHIPKYQSKYSLSKSKVGFVQYKEEPSPAASAIPRYGAVPERIESFDGEDQQQQQHQQQHQQYQPQLLKQYQQEQSQQYQHHQQQEYEEQQKQQQQQPHQHRQEQQHQQQQQQQQKNVENAMPKELHQLLNLQAQTPYHVIANRIFYKPKTIFVPKPIPEDIKGPYKYRSKIYFVKNEDVDQKTKERLEQEEKNQQQQQE